VVVIVPGTGSTKEEFYLLEGEFLRRGVATLSLDGPGQGEGARDGPVPHDFEGPIGAVIDALEERDDVDAGRVGLFGRSMGGYLTGRAAAFDSRIKAVSAAGGVFDLIQTWDFCKPHTHGSFMEMLQCQSLAETKEVARAFTLRGVAERIGCPLFLVHGDQDPTAPLAGAEEYHRIAGAKDKEIAIIAGGNHVVDNMPYLYRPMVADWMAEKLAR
jgi:pimeloyl-ACP methyl ester carboxylesterase